MSVLNTEKIDIESVVDELFDFTKSGIIAIPGFVTDDGLQGLQAELLSSRIKWLKAPRVYGTTYQELDTIYLGEADSLRSDESFPEVNRLREEYVKVYERFAERAKFVPGKVNSVGVHRYQKGAVGMGPHRDYSQYMNLVSIFVLAGTNTFGICHDREQKNITYIQEDEGMLILLRHPRSDTERAYRPLHCVGPVTKERYTVVLRQDSGKK